MWTKLHNLRCGLRPRQNGPRDRWWPQAMPEQKLKNKIARPPDQEKEERGLPTDYCLHLNFSANYRSEMAGRQTVVAGQVQFVAKRFGVEWTEDERTVAWPNVEQTGHVVDEYVGRLAVGCKFGGRWDGRFA